MEADIRRTCTDIALIDFLCIICSIFKNLDFLLKSNNTFMFLTTFLYQYFILKGQLVIFVGLLRMLRMADCI